MLKERYNEVMNASDIQAIEWLETFAEKNPSLRESIIVFKRYYKECIKELLNKTLTEEELKGAELRINTIQNYLKSAEFRKKITIGTNSENSLPLLTEEEINKIAYFETSKLDEENLETIMAILRKSRRDTQEVIRKIDRFYNMQLKYGHTARITYTAACNIERLNINNELMVKAILTSALMHDIGRFYQAANYNTLNDKSMNERIVINEDGEQIDLEVDHAVAGYYYALMDLYRLSALGKADYKDLLIHSITATIVRFHQLSNEKLKEFETSITDFESPENIEFDLINFIIESYQKADLITKNQSKYMYDKKHLRFIDRVINKIIEENRLSIQSQLENAFINVEYNEEDREEQIQMINNALEKSHQYLEEKLISYYQNPNSETGKEILATVVREIKDAINKSKGFTLISEEKIAEIIKSLPDYDIAKSIDDRFKKEKIPEDIKKIFCIAMNCTMDADKIDILNQRAIGIYNTEYNPTKLRIYPIEDRTLIDLLNEYFAFNIDKNNPRLSNNLLLIIKNNLNKQQQDWFKKQGIDLDELLKQTKEQDVEINNNHPLYNLIAKTPWKEIIANDKKRKKDYESKNMPTLSVPRAIFDENLANKSELDKMRAYRRLLIAPEQTELFQTSAHFSREVNTLHSNWNNVDQEHIIWNPIVALIWQLNQFIMVNIRTKGSIEFIRDNKILESIFNQYRDNPTIQSILKPYLAYSLLYIDILKVLKTNGEKISVNQTDPSYKEVLTYDAKLLAKIRLLAANREIFKNSIILKYMEYLDNNEKAYDFSSADEAPKITV